MSRKVGGPYPYFIEYGFISMFRTNFLPLGILTPETLYPLVVVLTNSYLLEQRPQYVFYQILLIFRVTDGISGLLKCLPQKFFNAPAVVLPNDF